MSANPPYQHDRRMAFLKYWLWQLFTKPLLTVVYLWAIAEGLRVVIPALAHKLHKMPFLHWMADYEDLHSIDASQVFSIFLLVASWTMWTKVLHHDLFIKDNSRESRFVTVLGTAVIAVDAALFYAGMSEMNWGGTVFSCSALLATVAYVGVIVFVSYMSLKLKIDTEKS
jgi:hypothetical protein